jgi:hypothetical protein
MPSLPNVMLTAFRDKPRRIAARDRIPADMVGPNHNTAPAKKDMPGLTRIQIKPQHRQRNELNRNIRNRHNRSRSGLKHQKLSKSDTEQQKIGGATQERYAWDRLAGRR